MTNQATTGIAMRVARMPQLFAKHWISTTESVTTSILCVGNIWSFRDDASTIAEGSFQQMLKRDCGRNEQKRCSLDDRRRKWPARR